MGKKSIHKTVKIDDYFNNGIIEMARSGKFMSMRNVSTPEQHIEFQERLKQEYPNVKKRIADKVDGIKNKIIICDPLGLLKFAKDLAIQTQINQLSEINYSREDIAIMRSQEYIQSVLVSTDNNFDKTMTMEEQKQLWNSIMSDFEDLFKEFVYFYNYWSADKRNNNELQNELLGYVVEAQMLYWVRGNRYQVFELEPIKHLLPPHDKVLIELFGISAEEVILGLEKIQYSLSQGIADAWMNLIKNIDAFYENKENAMPIIDKVFGFALSNVKQITNWDNRLIDSLSLNLGQYTSFFDKSEFSGWPIMELPIHKKPFIKIDGLSYCFEYYSFFDNIYRILQKEIFYLKPDYINTWNDLQKDASEKMVTKLFLHLLPGAKAYTNNYYPKNTSLKQMNENDLIIIYEDYLFIIEVKAGSFPQTPPIIDFDSHIKTYKKLAEEGNSQCHRTINYIYNHEPAPFYNNNKIPQFEIRSASQFKDIFSFSVTVANFNEFSSRAEKLNFINISNKTIVISYDDLLVYEQYFDSPVYFLHYLKQRKKAIDIPQIAVNDELDHLGLYINHNLYWIMASKFSEEKPINWYGFRKDLDEYFISLYLPESNAVKPKQDIPTEITNIIQWLEINNCSNCFELSNFFLDMSTNAKNEFCKAIHIAINRQYETGIMAPMFAFGEIRYCMFVSVPNIKIMNEQEQWDYVYSTVLCNESSPTMWISLEYDISKNLLNAKSKQCWYNDIPENELDRLSELSIKYIKSRIASYQRQTNKKIGRNEPCPCGSGKKYKKCCIKYE